MWAKIHTDYTPSNHPSHIACTPPINNKPPPVIIAAAASRNCLISSTLIHLAVAHSFNANYLDRFRSSTNNPTTCPCSYLPRNPTQPPRPPLRHTREHVTAIPSRALGAVV